MIKAGYVITLGAALLLLPAGARATQMINLSCVEALVAVEHADLAGVFSFVPEKDSAAAFADFMARNAKAQKKFIAKVDKDFKTTKGIVVWDHEVLLATVALYGSPLGETLNKPSPKAIAHMAELVAAPTLTLEEMTSRRGR